MSKPVIIAPSILAADYGKFAEEASRAASSQAEWIHIDIMDGHFVPNISFGPAMVPMIKRSAPSMLRDVHLMIQHPDRYIDAFVEAGAQLITVHVEADHTMRKTLDLIRNKGVRCGIALNPQTPFDSVIPYLSNVDLILCMTVNPGFGGQSFISNVLHKIRDAAAYRKTHGFTYHIEVDGGINDDTAKACLEAGANILVAGTHLFRQQNMLAGVQKLRHGYVEQK